MGDSTMDPGHGENMQAPCRDPSSFPVHPDSFTVISVEGEFEVSEGLFESADGFFDFDTYSRLFLNEVS